MQNGGIASERMRLGYGRSELAWRLGCTVEDLRAYEDGLVSPSADFLVSAGDLFGCSVDYLLGRTAQRAGRELGAGVSHELVAA